MNGNLSWYLQGIGLENFVGPVEEPMPQPGPDELLARVDAVGVCSSDAKMVRIGPAYPLFYGRDLAAEPVRLGHEVALTVLKPGDHLRERFHPGQRLGLQPDIFVEGQRTCFGVLIPGGFTRYLVLGPETLPYVFPVPPELCLADVALLEPWACVEAAYLPRRRLEPLPEGVLWIAGQPDGPDRFTMSRPLDSRTVILTDVPASLAAWVRSQPVQVVERNGASAQEIAVTFTGGAGLDDIILLDPRSAHQVANVFRALRPGGCLCLVAQDPLDGPVPVDVGRLHYTFDSVVGCTGPDIAAAYGPRRNRSDLRPDGVLWVAGAGGPMGRMHIQRALQMANGPRTILATNRGRQRLESLRRTITPMAHAAGKQFHAWSPTDEPERLHALLDECTGGRGCDDVVVMVPDLDLIDQAVAHLAPDGLLILFAGLPMGSEAALPLDRVPLHGAQFTGTSGSTLVDQRRVIEKTLAGGLSPAAVVAAVGGLRAARAALQAVLEGRFPGKVMLYPQLVDLPLLGLEELNQRFPRVGVHLGPGPTWTPAAERALIEELVET